MNGKNPCLKDPPLLLRQVQSTPLNASSTQLMWELSAGNHMAVLPRHVQGRQIMGWCLLKIVNWTTLLPKEFEVLTLHSKCFKILKFVFLSEVMHMSFCVKFSGLINQFRILEKSYLSPQIFNIQIYIWSLHKAFERFMVRQWSLPNYFASKMQSILWLFFFLSGRQ